MPQRLKIFEEPKNLSPVFAYVHNRKMTTKQLILLFCYLKNFNRDKIIFQSETFHATVCVYKTAWQLYH